MYSVYMHKSKIDGKIYIGKTNNIERRWRSFGVEYKREYEFGRAINSQGWDSFEHIILETGLSEQKANEREKYYISKFDTRNPDRGYNIAEGGNSGIWYTEHPKGMQGKHHKDDKRIKQSELMKKLNAEGKCGAVWKNGHPKGFKGHHHSDEYKERLRNIPAGKHPSAKNVQVIYNDGKIEEYECLKYLSEKIGVNKTTLIKIIKSEKPYKISERCHTNRENLKKLEGAIIKYR